MGAIESTEGATEDGESRVHTLQHLDSAGRGARSNMPIPGASAQTHQVKAT